MSLKQVHVYYSGSVQGVGFRYQTKSIASGFAVTGMVRNLPDGRVEMIAQAKEAVLEDFLACIDQAFGSYIRDKQMSWDKPTGCFNGFGIVF